MALTMKKSPGPRSTIAALLEGGTKMTILSDLKWKMAKWLWTAPEDMPLTDPEYTEWIKPQSRPLKNRQWHLYRAGRGDKASAPKHIDEFYHRGSYERHEVRDRKAHKAVMTFRGKGTKVVRRASSKKK